MERKALAKKILCLGIDGMDPRLTRKFVDEGKLPNVQKLINRGSARHDLVMVGAMPTVTPPMWTTLATGAYPNTHGITCFFRATSDPARIAYNFDSRNCKAEPLWNVFAEAGKKTLVWHWPGSAWPPTSDNPNLWVVDGSSPGSVAMSAGQVESEFVLGASENIKNAPTFLPKEECNAVAPCVLTDLDENSLSEEKKGEVIGLEEVISGDDITCFVMSDKDGESGGTMIPVDVQQSPISPAKGWSYAPEGAKEFTLLLGRGLLRRPCLILKNEEGVFDRIAIYKNKKEENPLVVIKNGEFKREIVDEGIKNDMRVRCNRNMKVMHISEDGSELRMWISSAMNMDLDVVWHPKHLFKLITENVGYPTPTANMGLQSEELINGCMLENWYSTADWQADALNYLIDNEGVEVVFSHFHNIDLQMHQIVRYMSDTGHNLLPPEKYQKFAEDIYIQADYYIGKFIHLLDDDWTIVLMSDHGQVCSANDAPLIGDITGVNVRVMQELGLTELKKDENGNELKEIDWENTYAVASRANHIYLNLKGRYDHGIIDPKDQYEWEEEIMTRLYGYKDPRTGKRVVALALRNRDAVLLGLGGPECGDIIYFNAEGYNYDHGESLGTCWGDADTSVSPIFIAAGPGIKKGFETDRVIREVDFAPTIAVLGGVRMPAQCEGAPVYQILDE